MQPSRLFYFFCFTLALIPFSSEIQITETLSLDLPLEPILIIWAYIGILSFVYQPKAFKTTLQSPLFLYISIYIFWLLINCLLSTNPILSIKFLLAKCWYIIPFCLVFPSLIQPSRTHWKYIGLSLCIPMLLLIFLTIVRHATTEFSFIGINKSLYPFFRNHVTYSALLVCLLPIGYVFFRSATIQKKYIGYALGIGLLALILSYSRGAWLASILLLIIPYIVYKKRIVLLAAIAGITIVASTLYVSYNNNYLQLAPNHDATIFHKKLSDHLQATVTLQDVSNAERLHRWVAGIRMIQAQPVTGFGTNSFYPTYKGYTVSKFKTWVSNNPDHSSVHNYFLLIALEQGLPGLAIFICLLVYLFSAYQKIYHHTNNTLHQHIAICATTILSMIVFLNFFSDLFETDKIGSVFWLTSTVVIVLQKQTKKTERQHFSL